MAGSSVSGQAVTTDFCIRTLCERRPVSGPEPLRQAAEGGNSTPVEDAFSTSAFRQELDGDLQLSALSLPGQHVDLQVKAYSAPGSGTQPPSQPTADRPNQVAGPAAAVRRGTRRPGVGQ
jgi:hypothetical protein